MNHPGWCWCAFTRCHDDVGLDRTAAETSVGPVQAGERRWQPIASVHGIERRPDPIQAVQLGQLEGAAGKPARRSALGLLAEGLEAVEQIPVRSGNSEHVSAEQAQPIRRRTATPPELLKSFRGSDALPPGTVLCSLLRGGALLGSGRGRQLTGVFMPIGRDRALLTDHGVGPRRPGPELQQIAVQLATVVKKMTDQVRKCKKGPDSGPFSSPDWTRTSNPSINSRMLCQLSYGGPPPAPTGSGSAAGPGYLTREPLRSRVRVD